MKKTLLISGGILNTLFGLFHVLMARGIQVSEILSPEARSLLHAFNAFGIIVIFYFAYISFFHDRELLSTRLGRTMLVLVALVFLSRAIEEFILFKFSIAIFLPCVLVGGVYVALFLLTGPRKSPQQPAAGNEAA